MKRKKMSKKASNKLFSKTVNQTNSKNKTRLQRGGERF